MALRLRQLQRAAQLPRYLCLIPRNTRILLGRQQRYYSPFAYLFDDEPDCACDVTSTPKDPAVGGPDQLASAPSDTKSAAAAEFDLPTEEAGLASSAAPDALPTTTSMHKNNDEGQTNSTSSQGAASTPETSMSEVDAGLIVQQSQPARSDSQPRADNNTETALSGEKAKQSLSEVSLAVSDKSEAAAGAAGCLPAVADLSSLDDMLLGYMVAAAAEAAGGQPQTSTTWTRIARQLGWHHKRYTVGSVLRAEQAAALKLSPTQRISLRRLTPEALALLPTEPEGGSGDAEPEPSSPGDDNSPPRSSDKQPSAGTGAKAHEDAPDASQVRLGRHGAFHVTEALETIAARQDANAPWPSVFQQLDATQGRKAALTYTADASVVHAWLLAHVLAPGIPLLGLDTEWSSTQPSVAVLQLATADAALVFHASVGTRRNPDVFSTPLDTWLATAVCRGFESWTSARTEGTALPRMQLPDELLAALQAKLGPPEAPWNHDAPMEYAPAWPPSAGEGGTAHGEAVVQPLGASSYLPSGLVAMATAFATDGSTAPHGATSGSELLLQAAPRVAGVAIEQDTSNLEKNWGVARMASVDTAALAGGMGLPAGLARQSRQLHGTHTWKSRKLHSVGNWNLGPLTTRPLEYAARDALYSRLNADYVLSYRAALKTDSPATGAVLPKHAQFGIGQPWQNESTKAALLSSFAYLGDAALQSTAR